MALVMSAMVVLWTVAKYSSNMSSSCAMGRKEKIPPPPLLMMQTSKRNLRFDSCRRLPMSWMEARSPMRSTVVLRCMGQMAAVATIPSIPEAPRLTPVHGATL